MPDWTNALMNWLRQQATLPTKEQFLADRNAMWGNTPQERMQNYANFSLGFAGGSPFRKAPNLLQTANPQTVQALSNDALFAARDAHFKALDQAAHETFQQMAKDRGPPMTMDQAIEFHSKPGGPPAVEPEVQTALRTEPSPVVDATTHPPGSNWQWNTNLRDWKSNQTGVDKPMSFNAQPTGLYDANGNVQTRLFDQNGVEYPPYGNNWIHHSELTPAPKGGGPTVTIQPEPPPSWTPPGDADRPFANDPDMTWEQYNKKLLSPDGGLTPGYDLLFQNGKPGNLKYAGVYRNERLEDVLDQLQHNFPDRLAHEDLHGGTLGEAVSRRIQANIEGRTVPTTEFQPTHTVDGPNGQFQVTLTGQDHPQLGLTEVQLQNGQRTYIPSETVQPIQPPEPPETPVQ